MKQILTCIITVMLAVCMIGTATSSETTIDEEPGYWGRFVGAYFEAKNSLSSDETDEAETIEDSVDKSEDGSLEVISTEPEVVDDGIPTLEEASLAPLVEDASVSEEPAEAPVVEESPAVEPAAPEQEVERESITIDAETYGLLINQYSVIQNEYARVMSNFEDYCSN